MKLKHYIMKHDGTNYLYVTPLQNQGLVLALLLRAQVCLYGFCDIVHKTLLQLCGNDSWSPAICGKAHTFKRPKLLLYDDVVRDAMVGVY